MVLNISGRNPNIAGLPVRLEDSLFLLQLYLMNMLSFKISF